MKMIHTRLGMWMDSLLGSLAASLIVSLVSAEQFLSPVSAGQSSITVNLSGIRSQNGDIVICLWESKAKDFPLCSKTASFQYSTLKPTRFSVAATFQNVPSGQYAISAFHDENQDGKLNRSFMGIPKEGIAISNMNVNQGRQERPSFDKAKFTVNGPTILSMSLKYF